MLCLFLSLDITYSRKKNVLPLCFINYVFLHSSFFLIRITILLMIKIGITFLHNEQIYALDIVHPSYRAIYL